MPLLAVTLLFYVPLLADWSRLSLSRTAGFIWCAGVVVAAFLSSYSAFASSNKGLVEDFDLAADGRRMGNLLNGSGDFWDADVGVLPQAASQ